MEQALVLISIVLGVAITFELENLNRLIRSGKVRWHWAQAIYAIWVLMCVIYYWWMMAAQEGELSIAAFLPIMFTLILLVLMSAVALPDKVPEEGLRLSEYYMQNRKYQWGLVVFAMLPISLSWLATLASRGGIFYALTEGWAEWVSILLLVWMMFADRWWKVGVGYLAISFIPIAWLSRTL